MGSRKSNLYDITSFSLYLSAVDHHVGSRKSNLYDITSFFLSLSAVDHHVGSRKSNPNDITSLLLSLSVDDHHVSSRKSNPYDITSFSLSLSVDDHHVGSRKSNPYDITSFSLSPMMTIVWLYLTLILLDTVVKGTASRCPLLRIGIHSCRNYLLSYRDFYVLSYRIVGVKIDGNCCPYLLSPTAPAPCTRCIGAQVARFVRPFESRPADPIRREVYQQLAAVSGSASSSGWVEPSATLPITPPPFQRGTEESTSQIMLSTHKGKRRYKC